jgi:hypothetical protein
VSVGVGEDSISVFDTRGWVSGFLCVGNVLVFKKEGEQGAVTLKSFQEASSA